MPTEKYLAWYRQGFKDGQNYNPRFSGGVELASEQMFEERGGFRKEFGQGPVKFYKDKPKTKRKLSAWNKFVKANSNKKKFQYANGKLKLKKMGIAYRKKRR
jgi:hypothetical protein